MSGLERIEDLLRSGDVPPGDTDLVVRAGPLAAEKFLEHALRQQRAYTFRGRPMASVSVSATVAGWTLEELLAGPLVTRSRFATCRVGTLRDDAYELLASGPAPHFDVVLEEVTLAACERLLARFSSAQDNPFKRRR